MTSSLPQPEFLPGLVRLSTGLENVDDILEDLGAFRPGSDFRAPRIRSCLQTASCAEFPIRRAPHKGGVMNDPAVESGLCCRFQLVGTARASTT